MSVFIISEIQTGINGLMLFPMLTFTDYNDPLLIISIYYHSYFSHIV